MVFNCFHIQQLLEPFRALSSRSVYMHKRKVDIYLDFFFFKRVDQINI